LPGDTAFQSRSIRNRSLRGCERSAECSGDLWGSVYPRSGFLHQSDDYKAGAVIAQRAGDVTTRYGQPHLYMPIRATPEEGYWPAGELLEGDATTGKWQELTPTLSTTCAVFPNSGPQVQAEDGLRLGAVAPLLLLSASRPDVPWQHRLPMSLSHWSTI
jgi:integrating conjugative element protein (TIGR03756 family)